MKVQKRNSALVDFDKNSIIRAVENAMLETKDGVDSKLSHDIANKIESIGLETYSVENIQDFVEDMLMESNRKDVAKRYIIYREDRNKRRKNNNVNFKFITDEFVSKYKHKVAPFTNLGHFVYLRTYSRWLPEEGRREFWWETVRRAVEYNCSLVPETTKKEAEKLYDNVFNLRQFLSGRTLYTGGTEASKKYSMSNFNCFSSDTEFLTDKGIKSFSDYEDNDLINVLNGNGAWSTATVKQFGEQEVYELILRRKGTKITKIVKTTKNHLWFVDKYGDMKTYEKIETEHLPLGKRLRIKARYEHQDINMCSIGIQHGIVYGDGTFDKKKNHCRISLIGKKQELLKFFNTGATSTEGSRDSILVYGLPYNWKNLPDTSYNVEYIKGFLYGLLLTDGSIGSSVRVAQTGYDIVKQLRDLFEFIGILTSDIKIQVRKNSNFGEYENPHYFTLFKEYIPVDWINIYSEDDEKRDWIVEKVTNTGIFEKVYCVIEPITNSFTLSSGIHTHNCSFTIANDFEAFKDLFYLLLLGAGVGLGVKKEDVIKLPAVRGDIEVIHKVYTPVPKINRKEYTSLIFKDNMVEILVGDSKEGWCQALEQFLKLFYLSEYSKNKIIVMNYDSVRMAGEKLKTFGGYASGYKPFMEMIRKIHNVLKKDNVIKKKLKPIDCLDIANIIGVSVVSGGVRRSSEVILFDFDDDEVYKSKSQLYEQVDGIWTLNEEISHRRMSNNSIQYDKKPSREQWHKHIQEMRSSGEPAFQNLEASKKRREDAEGGNPCFSGDMNLLTVDGYKTFEELDGKEVKIVNLNGDVSDGKVWCNGEKDIVEIQLSNDKIIKCTPNHILMLDNGKECEAKYSLNKELSAYYGKNPTVISIKILEKQKVYDFSEPSTNWGIVENVVAHNCMEIILRNRGMCNLTEVNGMGFVENSKLDYEGIYEAQRLSARAGYRMACIDFELYKWDIVNKEDMLLGCSLTGWQDMINATTMSVEDEIKLLKKLREIAHDSANELADKLGKNRPKLYTTVKPSGTISQLPTVSSGIHFSHSPYYIRRVRINAHDPLVDVLKELEYPVLPEVGQTWEKCDTVVVEFPVKSPEGKTKYDVSAIEQLEIYKKFMKHYCDHNVSITVHVRNNEWDNVENWVWDNWDEVIAVSFLSLDDNFYQLMPYEEINKEEYEKRVSMMSPFIASLINKYEKVEAELDIGNDECSSGSCPIR